MSTKKETSPESIVREIKRKTRRKFSAEEKIRIILEGLRGEENIADLCRKMKILFLLLGQDLFIHAPPHTKVPLNFPGVEPTEVEENSALRTALKAFYKVN